MYYCDCCIQLLFIFWPLMLRPQMHSGSTEHIVGRTRKAKEPLCCRDHLEIAISCSHHLWQLHHHLLIHKNYINHTSNLESIKHQLIKKSPNFEVHSLPAGLLRLSHFSLCNRVGPHCDKGGRISTLMLSKVTIFLWIPSAWIRSYRL